MSTPTTPADQARPAHPAPQGSPVRRRTAEVLAGHLSWYRYESGRIECSCGEDLGLPENPVLAHLDHQAANVDAAASRLHIDPDASDEVAALALAYCAEKGPEVSVEDALRAALRFLARADVAPRATSGAGLTDDERAALKGFVAGGNRAQIRGEWVWDQKSAALHAAVEQIIAARLAVHDREGETVTEWGVRDAEGDHGPWDHDVAVRDIAAGAEQGKPLGVLITRIRLVRPDVVTNWSPVTPDGGEQP